MLPSPTAHLPADILRGASKTIIAVLNADGGTLKTADVPVLAARLETAFRGQGHAIDVRIVAGKEISAALARAARSVACDCILVGGGDGSVSLAAALCWKHGKVLGVLPAGTMNFFARSLGMPIDLHAAVDVLAAAEVKAVDIGTANGNAFVHQVSLGIQPRMVELRKSIPYRSRFGKMLASVRAGVKVLMRPPSFRAEIQAGGQKAASRFSIFAVSNNVYREGDLPFADKIDDGVLAIYAAPPLSFFGNVKLAFDLALGRWKEKEHALSQLAERVQIKMLSPTRRRKMSIDGELFALPKIIDIELHRQALMVLAADKAAAV